MNKSAFGLNAGQLRILAMAFMLLDHLWATVMPGNLWMTMVGRMAFPIFAFQAAQGYEHTHDFRAYCKRLLVFGLLSEIPFNLMVAGSAVYPFHQNVMFTLVLGLYACKFWEERKFPKLAVVLLLGVVTFPDYGYLGVVSVLMFHVFRNRPWAQLLGLAVINGLGYQGQVFPLFGLEIPLQACAVFAWLPIRLYNGEKGRGGKALQYGSYIFYPAHMLLLSLL